jgi:hypothetical protein
MARVSQVEVGVFRVKGKGVPRAENDRPHQGWDFP